MSIHQVNRGQSEVLGAILVFGIIVLAVGMFQTYVIPQHVAETEQNHANQIDDEFTGVFTTIGEAAGSGSERSAKVTLGTRYRSYPGFLLPPSPTGTLQTDDLEGGSGEISASGDALSNYSLSRGLIGETCGMGSVNTKSLRYQNRYNRYQNSGEYIYETGLKYNLINGDTVRSQQRVVISGDSLTTINLAPITHGAKHTSGSTAQSLTIVPGTTGETPTFSGDDNVEITVPVHDSEAWNTTLSNKEHIEVDPQGDTVTIKLNNNTHDYRIRCTPIGIGSKPTNTPQFRAGNDGDDTGSFNPIGQGDLVLQNATNTSLTFHNNADTQKEVIGMRVPWYIADEDIDAVKIEGYNVTVGSMSWKPVSPPLSWPAGETDTISFQPGSGENPPPFEQNEAFAIVFQFSDGTSSTYLLGGGANTKPGNSGSGRGR